MNRSMRISTTPAPSRHLARAVGVATAVTLMVGLLVATPAQAAAAPPAPGRIDLKVLVLDSGGTQVDSLVAEMDRSGVPYTRLVGIDSWNVVYNDPTFLSQTVAPATPQALLEGHFQGVIVSSREGMSANVINALNAYEGLFGVREVSAFAYPGSSYSLNPLAGGALDGASTTLTAAATAGGFGYLAHGPVVDTGVYGVPTSGLSGAPLGTTWTPFLTVSAGTVMGVLGDSAGREQMVITAASNPNQAYAKVLGRGVLSWLTRGVSLSYERAYFSVQLDDLFLADDRWDYVNKCTSTGEPGCPVLAPIQLTSTDVAALVTWQNANSFRFGFAFNAGGASTSPTALVNAVTGNKASFYFLNHTWDHEFLGCLQTAPSESAGGWFCENSTFTGAVAPLGNANPASYAWYPTASTTLDFPAPGTDYLGITHEVQDNIVWANQNGHLTGSFDPTELVTGEHSGLAMPAQQPMDNPNLGPALQALGVKVTAGDASRDNASRTVTGSTVLTVPRHPLDIYYNTATYQEAVSEYDTILGQSLDYSTPVAAAASFTGTIVPSQAGIALGYALTNDPRPFFAHQSNVTGDRLILPVVSSVLSSYRGLYASNAPMVQTTLTQQSAVLQRQASWTTDRAGATAYLDANGVHIPSANAHGTMPLTVPAGTTGTAVTGFQPYDGSANAYGGSLSGWTNAHDATAPVTSPLSVGYKLAPSAPSAAPTGAPTNLTGQVTLSWPVPNAGSSAITAYDVTPYQAGVALTDVVVPVASVTVAAGVATTTINGLTDGVSTTFTVAAVNTVGTGPASAQSAGITPRSVPGAPTGVLATAVGVPSGSGQVSLTWTAPISTGGDPITGYVVTPYLGAVAQAPQASAGAGTAFTATGLAIATPYTFTVAATNGAGTGPASAPSAAATPFTVPGAPTGVQVSAGDGQVVVSWTAPAVDGGSPVTGYVVTPYIGGAAQPAQASSGPGLTFTATGLTNGVVYTVKVAAVNLAGTGASSTASAAVTPHSVPSKPLDVVATVGDQQVGLSWTTPASDGGTPITGYRVTPYADGVAQTPILRAGTGTTTTITGLTNGIAYTFTVAATVADGTGAASVLTDPAVVPFGKPGTPTALVATRGNASVNLAWTDGISNGRPITSYVVTITPSAGAPSTVIEPPGSTNVTIAGLTNGVHYTFTLHAVTAYGSSDESAASNVATPSGVPTVVLKKLATTVTPLTRATSVTYSWVATPQGAPVVRYDVYVRRASFGAVLPGTWTRLAAGITATSYRIAVRPGETLYVSVRAIDSAGTVSGYAPSSQVVTSVIPTRSLTLSRTGWKRVGTTTVYDSRTRGALAYTKSSSGYRKVYVVAATGVGYGTASVWIGRTKIATFSTAVASKRSASSARLFTISLTSKQVSALRGSVIVRVESSGRLVRLVGISATR